MRWVDSRTIIRLIEVEGWFKVHQVGSHMQFKHKGRKGRVTVPHPRKDVRIEDVVSIERQSGVKLRRR